MKSTLGVEIEGETPADSVVFEGIYFELVPPAGAFLDVDKYALRASMQGVTGPIFIRKLADVGRLLEIAQDGC